MLMHQIRTPHSFKKTLIAKLIGHSEERGKRASIRVEIQVLAILVHTVSHFWHTCTL